MVAFVHNIAGAPALPFAGVRSGRTVDNSAVLPVQEVARRSLDPTSWSTAGTFVDCFDQKATWFAFFSFIKALLAKATLFLLDVCFHLHCGNTVGTLGKFHYLTLSGSLTKFHARLLRKWKLYEQVQELYANGMSQYAPGANSFGWFGCKRSAGRHVDQQISCISLLTLVS